MDWYWKGKKGTSVECFIGTKEKEKTDHKFRKFEGNIHTNEEKAVRARHIGIFIKYLSIYAIILSSLFE